MGRREEGEEGLEVGEGGEAADHLVSDPMSPCGVMCATGVGGDDGDGGSGGFGQKSFGRGDGEESGQQGESTNMVPHNLDPPPPPPRGWRLGSSLHSRGYW